MSLWYTEELAEAVRYGYRINTTLFHLKSPYQTIDIVESAFYGRMLLLDGLVMTTECDEFIYHEMITHIPLSVHPNPKRVLVIGGGDGGTVREVLRHPDVQSVDLCEIDGDVIDACRQFLPTIAGALDDSRVHITVGDGVAFVSEAVQAGHAYDVVLIDSTDPVGPGEGLFTETFYQHIAQLLGPNGIMVNQTESPVAHPHEIQTIYRLLGQVFTHVVPYIAPIPTYPGGLWSWAVCSMADCSPQTSADPARMTAITPTLRYYNAAVHTAAFALPTYVQQRIQGTVPGITRLMLPGLSPHAESNGGS